MWFLVLISLYEGQLSNSIQLVDVGTDALPGWHVVLILTASVFRLCQSERTVWLQEEAQPPTTTVGTQSRLHVVNQCYILLCHSRNCNNWSVPTARM